MNVPMALVTERDHVSLTLNAAVCVQRLRELLSHPSLDISPAERERAERDAQLLAEELRPSWEEPSRVQAFGAGIAPF